MTGLEGDSALLRGVLARDEAALRELFERYGAHALALAGRVTQDASLAEDVVQEAFLSLWERPEQYSSARGSVRGYLFAIVHHRAVDRVRREQHQRRRVLHEAGLADTVERGVAEQVVEDAELSRRRNAVRAALTGIPVEQRQVIEMMYFDGKTQRAVADELGIPLGTVKSRTLLAMRKLQSALGGEQP